VRRHPDTGSDRLTAPPPLPAPFHEWQLDNGQLFASFHREGEGFVVRFPGLADFKLSADGSEISSHRAPGLTDSTFDHLLQNQIRPLALSLQGRNLFHASAVALGDMAVAFAGRSGQGKSTLAASFAAHGHGFLTDDGLELSETVQGFLAHPSHPSIRLWQDSLASVVAPDAPRAEPVQYSPKSRVLSSAGLPHVDTPLPLKALYVLAREDVSCIEVTPLSPADALIALIHHAFLLDIEDRTAMARHFDRLARLVSSVPIYSLDYPRRYERLGDVREAIVNRSLQP
jgi:hypothetical protein